MNTIHFSSLVCLGVLAVAACEHNERPAQSAQSEASSAPTSEQRALEVASLEVASAEETSSSRTGDGPVASAVEASERPDANPGNALATGAKASPAAERAPNATGQSQFIRTPDVIYVPTPQPVVDKMLEFAKLKKSDVVYDLGCGDGRIVVTAAKRYGTKAYGFDIDPERVAEARANVRDAKVEDLVTIEQKDIFTIDLSPANVVTLYLLPELNVRLLPQLEKLKPGSRVVSHDYDIEGVKPLKHVTMHPKGETNDHEVYLWKTPFTRM